MLKPGTLVAERYAIAEMIGEGGMGVVYSARDEKLRRIVAVKVLSPARVGNKTARARLKREARAAAAFDNPGIAQVFDVGDTPDGGAYLVMELVRGKAVRTMLPVVEQSEALRIVREVARTLDAAHRVDLVHRDVKPDNIMIRDDGRIVLLDFGLAKEVSNAPRKSSDDAEDSVVTAQGTMVGTPPYVAPEQIHGKGVGPASDQFALGVVAFGLLTGKKPWDAMSDLGMLGQILTEPPRSASALAPKLPVEVDAVFDRVLSKEAKMRYPSVEAFADALESAVTGRPIGAGAPEPARADSVPPPAQRFPSMPDAAPPPRMAAPVAAAQPRTSQPPPARAPAASMPSVPPARAPAPSMPSAPPAAQARPLAQEKSGVGMRFELDDGGPPPAAGAGPSNAPPAYQPPVWKIRESETPPPNPMIRMVIVGVLIAVIAAAAGVWYGRQGRAPQDGTPSGDVGQGR